MASTLKKEAVFLFVVFIFFLFFAILTNIFLPGTAGAVSVEPAVSHYSMDPGEERIFSIQIYNDSDEAKSFAINIQTFSNTEKSGVPIFDKNNRQGEIFRWIKLQKDRIVVAPKTRMPVGFKVKIPFLASPGSYFFAVFAEERGGVFETNEIRASFGAGALFGITVNGETVFDGSVESFGRNRAQGAPFGFSIEFLNNGTVLWQPAGTIQITDFFGLRSSASPINFDGRIVLPKGRLEINENWKGSFPIIYRIVPIFLSANLSVVLPQGEIETKSVSWWHFEPNHLIPIFILLIFLALYIILKRGKKAAVFLFLGFVIFGAFALNAKSVSAATTSTQTITVTGRYDAPDNAGVILPPPADQPTPETTITGSPAKNSNVKNPQFTFTSSLAGSTFECKLDDSSFAECSSPKNYVNLAEGAHAFSVRAAKDSKTDSTPAEYAWNIDSVAPQINDIVVNPSEHGASITWRTDAGITTDVVYALQGQNLAANGTTVAGVQGAGNYSAAINALTPNTQYIFLIRAADAALNSTESAPQSFTTLKDVTPPTNPNAFSAVPGDKKIDLSWANPGDVDFAGLKLVRKIGVYPTGSNDGTGIFTGNANNFSDINLTNGTLYRYALFSFDTSNNFSSGVLVEATPNSPAAQEAPPPPAPKAPEGEAGQAEGGQGQGEAEQGVKEEIQVKESGAPEGGGEDLSLEIKDFDFYLQGRTIKVELKDNTITALPGANIGVLISTSKFLRPVKEFFLYFNGDSYLVALDQKAKFYFVDFMAPKSGDYAGAFEIKYDNGFNIKIKFKVKVESLFVIKGENGKPLEGALVQVYKKFGDVFNLWDGAKYGQNSPIITNSSGAYGFIVPPGDYKLHFEKDGYRNHTTFSFKPKANILGQNFQMAILPSKLKDVDLSKGAAVAAKETFGVLKEQSAFFLDIGSQRAKEVGRRAVEIADDPEIEQKVERVIAPTTVGIAAVVSVPLVQAANILPLLRFIFLQPVFFFGRRKRKGWGIVYNSLTKLPVDLAIVRLVDASAGNIVQTRVTDRAGRYAFLSMPGKYTILVSHKDFAFPSKLLSNQKDDSSFVDLYHGEELDVSEENALLTPNIPMDPPDVLKQPVSFRLRKAGRIMQKFIGAAGATLAAVSLAIKPSFFVGGLLAAHVVLYLFMRRLVYPVPPKSWGIVYDKSVRLPIGRAIARIFDKQFNKLLETQITDSKGRYSFLVGKNKYYLVIEKPGYIPGKVDEIDLTSKKEEEGVVGVNVGLEPVRASQSDSQIKLHEK